MAWEVFGEKNSASNYDEFEQLVRPLMGATKIDLIEIGCSILFSPIFFSPDLWIEAPLDWSGNIVRGKTYSTSNLIGSNLWYTVQERINVHDQAQLRVNEPSEIW